MMKIGEILPEARSIQDWIVQLRRQIHEHPELMYEEVKTSKLVQETLDSLGISFRANIAKTGVLASIGSGPGPCVALRADMDALPIDEQADVEFRSKIPGKMHACGHDCHTAMLLGAARLLKQHEEKIQGTVKLLFQPAEEGGAGGKLMSDEGALDNPRVDRIFGLHVWPFEPTGRIASRTGVFLAATGRLEITISGQGGHAAMPPHFVDPVTTAAKVVTELQTIVSRETDPFQPAVVSVTSIHTGDAFNVIPPTSVLRGTIRALSTEQLHFLQKRVQEIAELVSRANQCTADVTFPGDDYPPTINDGVCWATAQQIWREGIGEDQVSESTPIMGGEDFAYYTEQIPGCFVGLGIRNEDLGATYSVHHPMFKVDEAALPLGAAFHTAFAFSSLAELR